MKVYTPDSPLRQPGQMFLCMYRDLIASRELSWQLTLRDIRAQYRQAALGVLWAFIIPIAHTLTWIFLNGSGVVSVGETNLPYPVYVLAGTMLWAIFIDSVNAPLKHTTAAKQMLAKINFPREALIVSGIYQTVFNGLIKIIIILPVMLMLKIYPDWRLALFPLGVMSLILTGTALGLLLTPFGLLYTDIGKSMPLLLQFLMYLSPVVFPMPESGWAATLFKMNPITPVIMTTRDWLTGIAPEQLIYFILINFAVVMVLVAVWITYRVAMPIIIERMSA